MRGTRGVVSVVAVLVLLGLAVAGWRHAAGDGREPQVQQASFVKIPTPGDDFPQLPSYCADPSAPMPLRPCTVARFPGRPTVVVWGDSHALMYLPALRHEAKTHRDNLVLIVAGGCPPALPSDGAVGSHLACDEHDVAAAAYLRRLAAAHTHHGVVTGLRVVVGSFWDGYRTGLAHDAASSGGAVDAAEATYEQRMRELAEDGTAPLFARLGRLGVPTDVIGEAAIVPRSPADCPAGRTPYRCDVPRSQALPDPGTTTWLHSMMRSLPAGSRYIDPTSFYCDSQVCHGTVDGTATWYDDVHLGAGLTALMGRYFAPSFAAAG